MRLCCPHQNLYVEATRPMLLPNAAGIQIRRTTILRHPRIRIVFVISIARHQVRDPPRPPSLREGVSE